MTLFWLISDPLLLPCDILWHCPVPLSPKRWRIIWMALYKQLWWEPRVKVFFKKKLIRFVFNRNYDDNYEEEDFASRKPKKRKKRFCFQLFSFWLIPLRLSMPPSSKLTKWINNVASRANPIKEWILCPIRLFITFLSHAIY